MGVLYDPVKNLNAFERKKKENVLESLVSLGIKESKNGVSLDELSYAELKSELLFASFRQN